jgi:hypothetical protein
MVQSINDCKIRDESEIRDQKIIIEDFLTEYDVPANIKGQAACLASHISNTLEMHDQAIITALAEKHPEYCVIEDAVRLDDLRAIGVARMLIDYGVDGKLRHESIDSDNTLIDGNTSQYPSLMKTTTGKRLVEMRCTWMRHVWMPQFWKETVTWSVKVLGVSRRVWSSIRHFQDIQALASNQRGGERQSQITERIYIYREV